MEAATNPITCGRLGDASGSPDSLVRFILGTDREPVALGADEIGELDDAVAQNLFSQGVFPHTPEELLRALDAVGEELAAQRTFVIGEGSHLPAGTEGAGIRAFLITRGEGPDGPDVIVSTSRPHAGFIEVMAWDRTRQGFNYYQTRDAQQPWIMAGNSADAFRPGSAGSGPFESHPSGNFLMKELRFPWVHWHSSAATIRADAVPARLAAHPWFTGRQGAQDLEIAVAMPAIRRWTRARLQAAVRADGAIEDPGQIMRSFLASPTVNLVSSRTQASLILNGEVERFDIPHAFFVDSECLREILGLPAPEPEQFTVAAPLYREILAERAVTIREGGQPLVEPPQDTHFAFVVPERAFEDIETVRVAIDMGLVSQRLAACLLMVDFANPIFSPRREALLTHVPRSATLSGGQSSFSEDLANAIVGSDTASKEETPEAEFAGLWSVGDEWPEQFAKTLTAYYEAAAARLDDRSGLADVFRLAENRRNRVREMPIGRETDLLFATPEPLVTESFRMLATGEVGPL